MSASDSRTYRLRGQTDRLYACRAVKEAPDGWVAVIKPPTRSLEQNAALHAALADIAAQVTWHGMRFDLEDWKRLCVSAYLREKGEEVRMVPALKGKGFEIIYAHTSRMTVRQLSELLDWVHSFGAENGVVFKEPPVRADAR
jgi:hypothetical protein